MSGVNYYLKLAASTAMRSPNKTHKTGCIIVYSSGGIIDWGWSHPSEWRMNGLRSMHAEIHALLRSKKIANLTDAIAFVATVRTKSGTIANGQPCISCATAMLSYGITKVVFTISEGSHTMLYLPDAIKHLDLKEYKKHD